jgi:O-succinylbenzoate synthase
MKIERIELRHVKLVLVSPFVTSMGTEYDEEHIIVRVDADGVTGWGESVAEGTPFYSYETVPTAWHILRDFLIPSILGKDISTVRRVARISGAWAASSIGQERLTYPFFR